MAMTAGTRLGPYEVLEPLGAGGMGEVYRATDTNLKRAVALKVLPATLLGDASRVARLQREAETLAALNHPNVAQVYGLERSGDITAIVMELVEGPTLADRLAAGRLPPNEALSTALQIAAGLEAAHERGIVHRDLKPANVKLTADGVVKVLDFGIATALDTRASAPAQALTTPAATAAGLVLGTAAYMSPEQARGRPVDKRTDVWAFGCVLYEMLTGEAAFLGDDVTSTLARVLEREPDLKPLPAGIAPAVRRTLELCLQKDPKKRLRDLGDVRLALAGEWATSAAVAAAPLWKRALPAAATLVIGVLIAGVYFTNRAALAPAPAAALPVTRFTITPPADAPLANLSGYDLAISPDGARVAYFGQNRQNGNVSLYVRELAGLEARPLAGSEVAPGGGAINPFFSPDGRSLGFGPPNQGVIRLSIDGAPSIKIADSPGTFVGGHWLGDDTIVYSADQNLRRVSAGGGGTPEPLVAGQEIRGIAPVVLPSGRGVLFAAPGAGGQDLAVVDLDTGRQKVLVPGGQNPTYLSTGHLVFVRDTTLMAVAFDAAELALTGEPVALLQGIRHPGAGTAADYALSANGTLVYVPDAGEGMSGAAVVWVDRQGNATGRAIAELVQSPRDPRVSPNGERLVLTTGVANDGELWSYDLRGRPASRLAVVGRSAIWSPDGREILFRVGSTTALGNLHVLPADGRLVAPRLVRAEPLNALPRVWSSAGDLIVTTFGNLGISVLSVAGTDAVRDLVATEYAEFDADLAPSGRWLAYVSNRSGTNEIYVQRYPDGVSERVSPSGGIEPRWSADGKELFYLQGTAMMAVAVETEGELSFATAVRLFDARYTVFVGAGVGSYDVARDGRFVMIEPPGGGADAPAANIVVVQNWVEELKQRVPTGR